MIRLALLILTPLHFTVMSAIGQVNDRQCSVGDASIPDCKAVLVEEEDDEDDRYYEEDVISWDELPLERKSYYLSIGWTREKWEVPDEYHMRHWRDLSDEQLKAVMTLGWTEQAWTNQEDDPDVYSKSWDNMTPAEVEAATILGYSRETWHTRAAMEDFSPIVFPLSIPELESMNLNYLEALDVKVGVVDGTATLNDEDIVRYEITMSDYIKLLRAGSKLYLKYEDHDPIKTHISSTIGSKILSYMKDALSKSPLRDMGYYLDEYDKLPLFEDNYSFFVGGTNTSTPMHYDVDDFNVLWLVEGRKRVVLIPNDERTVDKYDCLSSFAGHSCWSGENILDGPLPEYAVEVELGPGDGLFIPGKTWHAVKNLEPSVAYGLRIEPSQYKV